MPADPNPTVRRRRLGGLLRRLREAAGLTLEEAAAHLECHKATVSRLELGRSGVRTRDLRQLLILYGVTDEERIEPYLKMAKQGRESGWWERHADGLRPAYTDFIALEAEATEVRNYQPLLIPGLLQTPAYARAIIGAHPAVVTEKELERRVEVRLSRQALLTDGRGLRFWAVVGEGALRSAVGGRNVMREQLEHLLSAARLPNVDVQVLPCDVGEHPGGSGPFVILTFPLPEESHIVCEEGLLTSVYLDSVEEVKSYASAFDALRAAALSPRKSQDMIAELLTDL
ncbi:helix-turn-helix domain-containing protein [Streptomyces sp. HB2AG]|uniref:helix-turn-helix domain-containing protein n=1 Tax=Streptomyces sp. HB2AG TaxID=2983400 RepID=UPI0022AA09A8|nr:helix-turn-helix transcriptional regulator [Streptomyces sp. HB2AG]MCZ2526196.1 helix-turn-helix transcriptional regulator [Streptomyces sp. HB2AG]